MAFGVFSIPIMKAQHPFMAAPSSPKHCLPLQLLSRGFSIGHISNRGAALGPENPSQEVGFQKSPSLSCNKGWGVTKSKQGQGSSSSTGTMRIYVRTGGALRSAIASRSPALIILGSAVLEAFFPVFLLLL